MSEDPGELRPARSAQDGRRLRYKSPSFVQNGLFDACRRCDLDLVQLLVRAVRVQGASCFPAAPPAACSLHRPRPQAESRNGIECFPHCCEMLCRGILLCVGL
jgi:hypothetical protein